MAEATMLVHDPSHGSIDTHPRYPTFASVPPLPNVSLMDTIGASSLENFHIVGEAWAHVVNRWLAPGATVLDMGCGCGRTARYLLLRPDIRYTGFDIFGPAIRWADAHIAPLAGGRFRFRHFDAFSAHYNSGGALRPGELRFPADDATIDVAFAASLFTHLLEPDATHYLAEVARCLRPGGTFIASIHDEPRAGEGYSGREDRIDVARNYFGAMAERAGLAFREDLGLVCGQLALAFDRPE